MLIVDTAGRLHVDAEMMTEIQRLHAALNPIETLFVVDSMTGQDAANTAQAFNAALPLTGVVLTKTDGDARGGAALSIRQITGRPIKFLGVGEKTAALEPFFPDRVASRILGKVTLSLVEEMGRRSTRTRRQAGPRMSRRGEVSIWKIFREQMGADDEDGGIASLLEKMPGFNAAPARQRSRRRTRRSGGWLPSSIDDPGERRFPDIIKGSRKRRIAAGSGTQIQDVNRLLKQFDQAQKMMKKMKGGGLMKMMRGLQGKLPMGGLPPLKR